MALLGSLSVNVLANTAHFQRGMQGARGGVAGFKGSISGLGGAVTSSILAPLAAGAAAFFGFKAAIGGVMDGIDLAADMEQAEIAMGTMLGSTDAAKETLADLEQFAASTPFQLPGLVDASKTLLAFGATQEQIIPTMRSIGDVAAGTGKPIGELVQIFGKIQAKGKLTTETFDQLRERGVPIGKVLEESLGVAGPALQEMITNGEVAGSVVSEAFAKMSGEGGVFENMMGKQSDSFTGMKSTFFDNVDAIKRKVGGGLIEAFNLKGVMKNMTSFVQNDLMGWVESGIAAIKPWITYFGEIGSQIIGWLGEWMPVAVQYGRTLLSYWSAIGDVLGSVATAVWDFWAPIFNELFPSFGESIGDLKTTITAFLAGIEFGFTNWREVASITFDRIWLAGVSFVNNFVYAFTDVLPGAVIAFWNMYKQGWLNQFDFLKTNFTALWDWMMSGFTEPFPSPDFSMLTEGLYEEFAKIPSLADRAKTDLEKSLTADLAKSSGDYAARKQEFIQSRLDELTAETKKSTEVVNNAAEEAGTIFGEGVADGTAAVKDAAKTAAGAAGGGVGIEATAFGSKTAMLESLQYMESLRNKKPSSGVIPTKTPGESALAASAEEERKGSGGEILQVLQTIAEYARQLVDNDEQVLIEEVTIS